jgi:hypothetical protein
VGAVGLAIALLAVVLLVAALPVASAAVAERQPWPRRVRLACAAHLLEVATDGGAPVTVLEARIIDVSDAGERAHVLVGLPGGCLERLLLAPETDHVDGRRLRHWQAELIPVLIVGATTVDVHGPSGMVRGARLVAVDARLA